ncbi:O-antigen ligase [Devosia lucknowensis]|uniref:O-antigen ligase n=1 Tax=Devosia lucknowensis TaxID=1096929 RepID=A0A1Y6ECZ7_9HYPH|nr:O-antigen ligase family protein [Devosia lucknowensis]SMQ60458.1 O-antigen ligase [Devosia lucknowensis]
MHLDQIRPTLLLIALIAPLAMAPVAPEAGNILYMVAGAVSLLLLRREDMPTFARPIVWMPLLAMLILAIAYVLGAGSIEGALGIYFFAPMLLIGGLVSLARSWTFDGRLVAVLSLCGVAGAAAVALIEYTTTGTSRVGESVANPIHFADVALAVGFLATLGVVYGVGVARYLFVLGPALASVSILLSGTRGAVVALVAMLICALLLMVAQRLVSRRVLLTGSLAAVLVLAGATAFGAWQTSGAQRVLADLSAVLQLGIPSDGSTSERVHMYTGGFAAFMDSPIFGHGPFAYISAAIARSGAALDPPHLHSDLVNFAASGGILALIAYGLFIAAPIVEVLRTAEGKARKGLIVVVCSLVFGYFIMGLTNAVLGMVTLTVLYSCIAVIVGLASRDGMLAKPGSVAV